MDYLNYFLQIAIKLKYGEGVFKAVYNIIEKLGRATKCCDCEGQPYVPVGITSIKTILVQETR